jgi:hypothetical protein
MDVKKNPARPCWSRKKIRKSSVHHFYFFFNRTNCFGQVFPGGTGIIMASGKKQAKETCNPRPILLNNRGLTKVDIHMNA